MTLVSFLFYFFTGVTALSALGLLLVKNIFHAALALLVCLLSIAALFVMMNAEFLAVSQLLLYAGGVVILLIFGIMLTNKMGGQPIPIDNTGTFTGLLVGAGTFFLLVFFTQKSIYSLPATSKTDTTFNGIEAIGVALLTDYVLPFEIAGVLLLVVLVGVATLAGFKQAKN